MGADAVQEDASSRRVTERRLNRMTSRAALDMRVSARFSDSWTAVGCSLRWAAARCCHWRAALCAAYDVSPGACHAARRVVVRRRPPLRRMRRRRTPGSHLRVTFDRPDHPIAYGYPAHTYVFRQNFPLYALPRHWLRMAYCTTCLDGPVDPSGVVLEWGDRDGAPFVVSGQAWGEQNLSRARGDFGYARRCGARGGVQFQSAAPGSESR